MAELTPFTIPLFDLDLGEKEMDAVTAVLRSGWLTMGDVTARFETAFSRYMGVPHSFAVSSGTAALHLALKALGIGPGQEVICPSLTFVATANAILYAGARPIFADIVGPEDLNLSPESVAELVTDKTAAILVVHYAGYPCDMDAINEIASRHGLRVIEDAAHAPGAAYFSRTGDGGAKVPINVGGLGDVGCFSFFSNKNMATGEGGMLVTREKDVADRIRVLRSHGMTSLTLDRYRGHSYSYDVVEMGFNYRIDEMRSAIGLVQLEKLEEKNSRRRSLDAFYRNRLGDVEGLTLPFGGFEHQSSCHILPVLLREGMDRERFMAALKARGVQTSIHYPPVHQFTFYRRTLASNPGGLERTEHAGRHEVTLPLYPSMTEEQVNYVVSCVKEALRSEAR